MSSSSESPESEEEELISTTVGILDLVAFFFVVLRVFVFLVLTFDFPADLADFPLVDFVVDFGLVPGFVFAVDIHPSSLATASGLVGVFRFEDAAGFCRIGKPISARGFWLVSKKGPFGPRVR